MVRLFRIKKLILFGLLHLNIYAKDRVKSSEFPIKYVNITDTAIFSVFDIAMEYFEEKKCENQYYRIIKWGSNDTIYYSLENFTSIEYECKPLIVGGFTYSNYLFIILDLSSLNGKSYNKNDFFKETDSCFVYSYNACKARTYNDNLYVIFFSKINNLKYYIDVDYNEELHFVDIPR